MAHIEIVTVPDIGDFAEVDVAEILVAVGDTVADTTKVAVAPTSSKLPAMRTTKRSPTPWSKISSGGVRESAQVRTPTDGDCPNSPVWAMRSCCQECAFIPPATKR